jgi:hypothetical protein
MKDAKEGMVVAGGQGRGNSLTQLSYLTGVTVDHLGNVYVADPWNHGIMCWSKQERKSSVKAGEALLFISYFDDQKKKFSKAGGVTPHASHPIYARGSKGSKQGRLIVGENGIGQRPNQLSHVGGILLDRQGHSMLSID